jgi:acyl-CoA synthetase (NDP forming)
MTATAVIFVVGSSAQFNPELAVAEPLLPFARTAKPFAVALTPSAEKSLALLTAAGARLPPSRILQRGDGALSAAPDVAALARSGRTVARVAPMRSRRAASTLRRAAGGRSLRALGVPMARSLAVPDAKRVVAAVAEVGAPVVLKSLSADIAHKTEAGGVAWA